MQNNCGNCEYFVEEGACRRYPPTPILVPSVGRNFATGQMEQTQNLSGVFAPTAEGMLCGEHKPSSKLIVEH